MSTIDISVLVTVGAFAVVGAWKRFSWQAVHLGSVVAAFLLASSGAPRLARVMGYPNPFGRSAAWLLIFALVAVAGYLLGIRLKEKIAQYRLKAYDRELGAVLGGLKGSILCAVVLFFLAVPDTSLRHRILRRSWSGIPLALLLEACHRYIPAELHREVHPGGKPADGDHWDTEDE